MLIALLKKGEITKEKFSTKWDAFWGLSKTDRSLREMLGKVFSAYEYGEDELRSFITEVLSKNREALATAE